MLSLEHIKSDIIGETCALIDCWHSGVTKPTYQVSELVWVYTILPEPPPLPTSSIPPLLMPASYYNRHALLQMLHMTLSLLDRTILMPHSHFQRFPEDILRN